jgi:hypothetical protein
VLIDTLPWAIRTMPTTMNRTTSYVSSSALASAYPTTSGFATGGSGTSGDQFDARSRYRGRSEPYSSIHTSRRSCT